MTTTARANIIDTLYMGFAVVHRQPWLILFPAAFDLAFWQGPRVSIAPVIQSLFARYEGMIQNNPDLARAATDGSGSTLPLTQEMSASLAQANLLHLLAWQLPSLLSASDGLSLEVAPPFWQITSLPAALLAGAVLLVLGLLGTSLYLSAVSFGVRETAYSGELYARFVLTGWFRLTGFYLLMAAVFIPIMFVGFVITGIAGLISATLITFVVYLSIGTVFLAWLFIAFADEAIFVSDAGVRRAIRLSIAMVAAFFWSASAFLSLSLMLAYGLTIVWLSMFEVHPIASVAAIAGHAYVATGLAAAAMVFYRGGAPAAGLQRPRGVAP